MTQIASFLEEKSFILRSGGAPGADSAFEKGVQSLSSKEIYLPWKGFEGNPSSRYNISEEALLLASQMHPAWGKCSSGAQKLHARNGYQVLGQDLKTPSRFVLCWTKNGKDVGGTSQALRIARKYEIPVFNLYSIKDCLSLMEQEFSHWPTGLYDLFKTNG